MGIARRKAGAVVKCPKCAGEIIVPAPEETDTESPDQPSDGAFDDPNFDPRGDMPAAESPTGGFETPVSSTPAASTAPKRMGVFLSVGSLVISVVVVVLLLILTFVMGLVIGQKTAPAGDARTMAPWEATVTDS